MEKRQLESHLARTEMWSEHLGKWQASVQSVEVSLIFNKCAYTFVNIV